MSASSAARISSRLTSGAVLATGIVSPSSYSPGALGARVELEEHVLEPGRRAHQDRRVAVDRQVLAVDLEGDHADAVLDARPSATSPIRTPATRIVWPWPGTTACAVSNSALSSNGRSSRIGIRRRCFWTMYVA